MNTTLMIIGLALIGAPIVIILIYGIGRVFIEMVQDFLIDHDPAIIMGLIMVMMFVVGFTLMIIGRFL